MLAPEYIAPTDSLLGQLQCGRGEGYRRVLHIPRSESHAYLMQCITHDPRLDVQVESRAEFYASIAVEIDLSLEPLVEYLRKYDDKGQFSSVTTLTVTTLTQLAMRSYKNAREILCDYIGWGQWWDWPLTDLLELSDEAFFLQIASAVERHFSSDEELFAAIQGEDTEAFKKLSRHSLRIEAATERVLAKLDSVSQKTLPDLTSLSPRELLTRVDHENFGSFTKPMVTIVTPADTELLISHLSLDEPYRAYVALAGLTHLAPPSIFQRLVEFWSTIPEWNDLPSPGKKPIPRFIWQRTLQAILALPSELTLPLARDWVSHKNSRNRHLAERLLERHATPEDVPFLRQALQPLLIDRDAEWGCFVIRAFSRLPNIGVVPELVDIFYKFRFSTGRAYAAKAIQVTSPDYFQNNLALESLWDCEEDTRALGTKFVSLSSDESCNRLRLLAHDPFESEVLRAEAKQRLSTT